jgi:hypothetical protein
MEAAAAVPVDDAANSTGASDASATSASSLSALRDNIIKKGVNSYYFAHKNTAPQLTTTLGDVPRLLASSGGAPAVAAPRVVPITEYSHYDDDATYVVLVELDAAVLGSFTADAIAVEHGERNVSLRITLADRVLVLTLCKLFATIASARAVKGKTRVSLKLKKVEATAWTSLLERDGGDFSGDFSE